jgi:multidrug efflux pump subunit AcrB
MGLDRNKLEETGSSLSNLYFNLLYVTPNDLDAGYISGKDGMVSLVLREANKNHTNVWTMENTMLASGVTAYRLKDIGKLKKERTGDVIRKYNQEHELNLEYDFIGPWELNRRVRDRYIEQIRAILPMGFSIHDTSGWWGWQQDEKSQYWLLLMVAAVIFLLSSILFESLKQPLAVLSAIPVSFIGLFLTFYIFKLNFDQGGYAAMLLLCALTINASIYIINDYNNLKKQNKNLSDFALYMKAFNNKIIPILLTIFSTILGLMPFLIGGKEEGFWFSLAAGASGGLLFSLIAVIVWLPMMMIKKQ